MSWLLIFLALFVHVSLQDDVSQRAIDLIQSQHAVEAARLLESAVARHPEDGGLWNLLGIAQMEAGRVKLAREAFGKGLALAPNSPDINENLGLLYFRQSNYAAAKGYLARAVKLGSEKPGVLFSLAAADLRTGETAAALAQLQALESALGDKYEYWQERARAELLTNSIAAAADSFDRALVLSPNNVALLNDAANVAERQGVDEKALAYLIRARAAAPSDVSTLIHFGSVCIRRDLGPDARDALAKAYQLQPSNKTVLYLLARANISLQNWQQAYQLFEQFSQHSPRFAPAYYALGWLAIRLNRLDDARTQLRHALSLAPALSGAAFELAQLELNDGRLDSAERLLRAVILKNPLDAPSNTLLSDILMRKGQLGEAQRLLNLAVQQDPALAQAHYKLALLLLRLHEPEKAEQERTLAAHLTEEEKRASKTQLKLVLPEMESAR